MSISVGAVGTASTVVTPENTAAAVGSGALPVFATPYMIALMENAACNAIADGLEEGQSSVWHEARRVARRGDARWHARHGQGRAR